MRAPIVPGWCSVTCNAASTCQNPSLTKRREEISPVRSRVGEECRTRSQGSSANKQLEG